MAHNPDHDESSNLGQLDTLSQRLSGQSSDDDGLGELQERPVPGMLRFLPPLLQEFWAKKAYFTMDQDGNIAMEGFYKNGPLRLEFDKNNQLFAVDKRQRRTAIRTFDDLVDLNFFWWKQSNTKTQYTVPLRPWVDSFVDKKLVRRKVIFLPIDADEGAEDTDQS